MLNKILDKFHWNFQIVWIKREYFEGKCQYFSKFFDIWRQEHNIFTFISLLYRSEDQVQSSSVSMFSVNSVPGMITDHLTLTWAGDVGPGQLVTRVTPTRHEPWVVLSSPLYHLPVSRLQIQHPRTLQTHWNIRFLAQLNRHVHFREG